MLPSLIGLAGKAGSGKNTAANLLDGYTQMAFADPLRQAVYALNPWVEDRRLATIIDEIGWDEAKRSYPYIRELLQRMGTEVGRDIFGSNFWVDLMITKIHHCETPVVITDVRFPNEVEMIHARGGIVLEIVRDVDSIGAHGSHASENQELDIDISISNNGTIAELKANLAGFIPMFAKI